MYRSVKSVVFWYLPSSLEFKRKLPEEEFSGTLSKIFIKIYITIFFKFSETLI